jgi:hypothetical protein
VTRGQQQTPVGLALPVGTGAATGDAGALTGDAGAATCTAGEVGCDGLTPTSCQNTALRASGPACPNGCNKGACTGEMTSALDTEPKSVGA